MKGGETSNPSPLKPSMDGNTWEADEKALYLGKG
jgi:hypothetical protein